MILRVIGGVESGPLVAVGRHHAERAVIEVHAILFVHHAHVVGAVGEQIGPDQVHVFRVCQDHLLEDVQGEPRKLHGFGGHLAELRRVLRGERLGHAARQAEHRVHGLARGERDQVAQLAPHGDHFLSGLDSDLGDDAEDVALRGRRLGSDNEIRTAQEIEVQRVVLHHERAVDQFADFAGGGRRVTW